MWQDLAGSITAWQWALGGAAALLVGLSKTGIPGVGILVVTLLAQAFGGWNSIGIMLPMLILGDCFAVLWYKRHAQWGTLVRIVPWVLVGLGLGTVALQYLGQNEEKKALMGPVIGGLVLIMLILSLIGDKLGIEHLTPRSKLGTAGTGMAAGFATTLSNAAGPIMMIYLAAEKLGKNEFMGTIAWYFFLINLTKVPIFAAQGLFTREGMLINLVTAPAVIVGVFAGKWLLPRFSEKAFTWLILALAAAGAVNLIVR